MGQPRGARRDDRRAPGIRLRGFPHRWHDEVERVEVEQQWGATLLHFENDRATIARMMTARALLLELQCYDAGEAGFPLPTEGRS